MSRIRLLISLLTLCWLGAIAGVALEAAPQTPVTTSASVAPALGPNATGEDVYRATCITCHGPDGKGSGRNIVGFDTPLPDFTDCAFATAEADVDWWAVVHEGGRIRGLSRRMPAFGDALTTDQIQAAVGYVRGFCPDPSWPKGDLNFPRAFFTEKAFPENEWVWTSSMTRGDDKAVGNEFVYEKRFGARNQIEAVIPVDSFKTAGAWTKGIGDVAFAFRRTLFSSTPHGTIAASGLEVAFPTGNADRGLGNGYHIIEPFAMIGQALPRNSFLQMHGGIEFPSNGDLGTKEAYLRTALGTTFMADRGFGRSWSPQIEVIVAKPFGAPAEWDIVPQLQVTLSKIQHVAIAGGVRIPLNERDERRTAVVTYLLWDFFDGGFTQFWK